MVLLYKRAEWNLIEAAGLYMFHTVIADYCRNIAGGIPLGNSKFPPRKSGSVNYQLELEIEECQMPVAI